MSAASRARDELRRATREASAMRAALIRIANIAAIEGLHEIRAMAWEGLEKAAWVGGEGESP